AVKQILWRRAAPRASIECDARRFTAEALVRTVVARPAVHVLAAAWGLPPRPALAPVALGPGLHSAGARAPRRRHLRALPSLVRRPSGARALRAGGGRCAHARAPAPQARARRGDHARGRGLRPRDRVLPQ